MKKEIKDTLVPLRITSKLKDEVDARAKKEGMTRNGYITKVLENPNKRKKRISREEMAVLNSMMTRVNQIEAGYHVEENQEELLKEVRDYVKSKSSK